jgi:hypothetical protein
MRIVTQSLWDRVVVRVSALLPSVPRSLKIIIKVFVASWLSTKMTIFVLLPDDDGLSINFSIKLSSLKKDYKPNSNTLLFLPKLPIFYLSLTIIYYTHT